MVEICKAMVYNDYNTTFWAALMNKNDNIYAQRHYEMALDLFENNDCDKAIAQLEKAIKITPTNPDLYSTKGVFLHSVNDITGAIEAYKQAIEVAPDHAFSHYNLGLIYMKQNKPVKAIQEWEAVIRNKPTDVEAIFNIAVALSHLGKPEQAIPFYKKVLQIDPSHIQAHQNLGVIYRDHHDFTRAKKYFIRLKNLDSTYAEVVDSEIAKCKEQEFLARLDCEIKQSGQHMNNINFENEDTITCAYMALIQEDYDKAHSKAEEYLLLAPNDLQALLICAQALQGQGQTSDAIAKFMQILTNHPDCADAHFHLGNIFLGLGQLEKSLGYFEAVLKINPDEILIKENVASIKAKLHSDSSEDDEN